MRKLSEFWKEGSTFGKICFGAEIIGFIMSVLEIVVEVFI